MAFYAGFDILQYPNMAMMNWLNQNTNLVWCGYYLAPAPNRPTSQWMGKYSAVKDKWGVLPVDSRMNERDTAAMNLRVS